MVHNQLLSLSNVESLVRWFDRMPRICGGSQRLVSVWGPADGRHTKTATSLWQLPMPMPWPQPQPVHWVSLGWSAWITIIFVCMCYRVRARTSHWHNRRIKSMIGLTFVDCVRGRVCVQMHALRLAFDIRPIYCFNPMEHPFLIGRLKPPARMCHAFCRRCLTR